MVATCEALITVVPTPTIVTCPVTESIVATPGIELVYVRAPVLVDVGGVTVNCGDPNTLSATMKSPKTGSPLLTVNVVVEEVAR